MRRKISVVVSALLAVTLMAGCGQAVTVDPGRNIELVEPVNASVENMETVQRRNLYDGKVYEANVYPYVEEYGFEEKSYEFSAYGAFPGDTVKKGDILIHTTASRLETQIESMENRVQKLTENYQKYCADADEKRAALQEEMEYAEWVLGNLTEYMAAGMTNYPGNMEADFVKWTGTFNKAEQDIKVLDLEREEKTALYQLDYDYYNSQLQEMLEEKEASYLYSGMDGQIVGIQQLSEGQTLRVGTPLVAVADMSRKYIKCEKMDERLINAAADIYAFIDGKRYEVIYEKTEDNRCSTFVLQDAENRTSVGDYAMLVYLSKCAKDVLTLSNEAIHQDLSKRYVHILRDGKVTTKEIKTGMSDGVFTEIVSGLEEGDKVVVNEVVAPGKDTAVLTKETVVTTYASSATMYYPVYTNVTYLPKYVEGNFVEYLVMTSQKVEKGEPYAKISLKVDRTALEEKETELLREKQRLNDYIETNKESLETNESVAKRVTSWQEQIDALEEIVEEMQKEYTTTIVTAPEAGQVGSLPKYNEINMATVGRYMGVIYDTGVGFLQAEPKGFINYGTILTLSYTNTNGQADRCQCEVVTLTDYGVSEAFSSDGVLVKLPDDVLGDVQEYRQLPFNAGVTKNKLSLQGNGKVMKDVVQIPSAAVTVVDGKTYVNVLLQDGSVKVVPFLSGGNSRSYYWAIEGLEAGMTVCW